MRVSTQLLAGYLLAVAAIAALAVLSHLHLREMARDVEHIGEEWREMDLVARALAAMHEKQFGSTVSLAGLANDLGSRGSEPAEGAHERAERNMFLELSRLLRKADGAQPGQVNALEEQAHGVAAAFRREDAGRVPGSLREIRDRGQRVQNLGVAVSSVLLLVPILFFLYLRRSIAGPLGQIQRRVESLGGTTARRRQPPMRKLADSIEKMAVVVEQRQHELEAEVETRTEQLRHSDRLGGLGRVAAAVAHEINNPLASMGLCVEGMSRDLAQDDLTRIRSYVDTLHTQIDRCTSITSKMLTYARYRPAERGEVAARVLVDQAIDLVAGHARRRRIALVHDDQSGGAHLHGDVGQLQQVAVNLLLNAIDASPPGEEVRVTSERSGTDLVLRFQDCGPGVAAEERESIFLPFVTTKPPGEGTGLGLAISREITEVHGGRLHVADSARGAVFELRLPASREVSA